MPLEGVDESSAVNLMLRGTMSELTAGSTGAARGSTGATRGLLYTAHGGSVRLTARGRSLLPRRECGGQSVLCGFSARERTRFPVRRVCAP